MQFSKLQFSNVLKAIRVPFANVQSKNCTSENVSSLSVLLNVALIAAPPRILVLFASTAADERITLHPLQA
jgi:hypothetical protein